MAEWTPSDQQLEIAARLLCELRGLDPDSTVEMAMSYDPAEAGIHYMPTVYHKPHWQRLLPEAKEHLILARFAATQ